MKQLTTAPAVLSPTQITRLVDATLGRLKPIGVEATIEIREDGQFALVMPPVWIHFFLATLVAQAEGLRTSLTRAGWEAYRKSAALKVHLQEAAVAWEKQRLSIRARHAELVEGGLSRRDSIRQIKRESHGDLSATVIDSVVGRYDPLKKKRVTRTNTPPKRRKGK